MPKEEQITQLQQTLQSKNLSKSEYIRIQAVLLKKEGYSLKEIVKITQKSFDAIQRWITKYNQKGISGLLTHKPKVPNSAKLSNSQKDKIKEILLSNKPKEYGLIKDFWDVPTLKRLVKSQFGIEYKAVTSYRRLLEYCGFSYQKVEFVDKKQNKEELEHFKKRYVGISKTGTITMSW